MNRKLKPLPSLDEVLNAHKAQLSKPRKSTWRRCLPHTCHRAHEGRSPMQWGIFSADTCDGCLAQAMQCDDDLDTAWTVDRLVEEFSDQRKRRAAFMRRVLPDAQDAISRAADRARILRVQEAFMATEPTNLTE